MLAPLLEPLFELLPELPFAAPLDVPWELAVPVEPLLELPTPLLPVDVLPLLPPVEVEWVVVLVLPAPLLVAAGPLLSPGYWQIPAEHVQPEGQSAVISHLICVPSRLRSQAAIKPRARHGQGLRVTM